MNIEEIEKLAREQMGTRKTGHGRESGYILDHGFRVAKITVELSRKIGGKFNCETLYAAGLLHDISKGEEPHNELGAKVVEEKLAGFCSPEELSAICRLVRDHNRRGQKCPPDSLLVQDADVLDHIGPQGVWLAVMWCGVHDLRQTNAIEYFYGSENQQYLKRMRKSLNFKQSKKEFDRRLAMQKDFFKQLKIGNSGRPMPKKETQKKTGQQ